MENLEYKNETYEDKYNKIKNETKEGLNILKDEFTKKPEDLNFTPSSQEEDIERAALLNDEIQQEALNDWYTPPSDVPLDEEWNPIY